MVLITGQKAIHASRQAHFQIVDVVASMKPLTKLSQQIVVRLPSQPSSGTLSGLRWRSVLDPCTWSFRKMSRRRRFPAFRSSRSTRPISRRPRRTPSGRRAELILSAKCPLLMFGAGASRPRLAPALSEFVRRVKIPFFNTQMGKGAVGGASDYYVGTAALSERDYVHRAIDCADLIITIGHDTIEKPPFIMGRGRHQVLHIGFTPATVEEVYYPQAELIGDIAKGLDMLATELDGKLKQTTRWDGVRADILRHIGDRANEDRFPLTRSGSSTTSARSCHPTASSRWTTGCTRYGSRATTARTSPTRCCSTTRLRRWERGFRPA